MIKNIFLIILGLGLIGCAKEPSVFSVDSAFYPHYEKFVEEGSKRSRQVDTNNLVMKFGKMPKSNVIAYCTTEINDSSTFLDHKTIKTPVVVFSEYYWNASNEVQRQETVNHELGHCLLSLGHNDSTTNTIPDSIMNTYSISRSYYYQYVTYMDYYLDQLFGLRTYALRNSDGTYVASTAPDEKVETQENTIKTTSTTWVSTVDGCDHHDTTEEETEHIVSVIEKAQAEK